MVYLYVNTKTWVSRLRDRVEADGERGDTIERVIGYGIGALAAAAIGYGLWQVAEGGVENIDLGF
jgi:hypothetical protein